MIIVETERLRICEVSHKDVDMLALVLSDTDIMKYSIVGIHNRQQIIDFIKQSQKNYQERGYGQWAIYSKLNNSFLGVCGLNSHIVENEEILHVSYRLAHSQQGKGYASEATLAVIDFCRNKIKVSTISALIDPCNVSSIKVANRTGFTFKRSSIIQGFEVDIYQLSLGNASRYS